MAVFEGKQKVAITPKPERSHLPKLVCMHFTSISIHMNFLSRSYFLTPMDYSSWFKGKFWLLFEGMGKKREETAAAKSFPDDEDDEKARLREEEERAYNAYHQKNETIA